MKRLIPAVAIILGWASAAWAAPPAPLTTLHVVAAITNAQASQRQPVSFEATVTYYRSYASELFVQEGNDAIYVQPMKGFKLALAPGDRIRVTGTMHESFRPVVDSKDITVVGHGPLPKPEHPSFVQMMRGEADSRLVTVRAVVRAANLVFNDLRSTSPTTYLRMLVQGSQVGADIDSADESALKGLLDAEIEITGVAGGHFDSKMQMTGILLHVQSLAGVKVLKRAGSDPWSLPVTPMDRIIAGFHEVDLSQRTRVRGTIIYFQPGTALVLQDGPRSLWIDTDSWGPMHVGDVVDAIGFPSFENHALALTRSEVRDSLVRAPVTPTLFTPHQLVLGGNNGRNYAFDLVSVEGLVVTEVRQVTQDEYMLESDGRLFSAILSHSRVLNSASLSPMKEFPLGTRVRVTGICIPVDANLFNAEVPFNILMRNADDVVVVARPPWLNVRHLTMIVGLLLCVVIAFGVRSWVLERRDRRGTAALAYLEGRRSRILEDINGARPLAEIIEKITEMVSYKLNGAPCWCEIADGALLGNCPAKLTALRIVQEEIPARSGPPLGVLFAGLDPLAKPHANESEVFSMGAALAALAIETRRLYSDLLHRSEFDLLTDIPNRFSLEKQLETLIHEARTSAGVLGFVFIDLDRFKQVNDQYGHQTGDLYLQAAAQRMKRQLRPGDMLARLGGDEFAVVVRSVRNRSEVEEIASRLQHCFDEPFAAEGRQVHGSASMGIALYPEDATNRDGLLSTADAAMYAAKQARKRAAA
ncbi:MAG: GGDEF domain-containing protein [Terracidiphilus sp.]